MRNLLFFLLILTLGCETTPESTEPEESLFSEAKPKANDFCEKLVDDCGSMFSPTYCEFRSPPLGKAKISARSKSPCLAKKKLFEKLCETKIDRTEKFILHCAPDPTLGECEKLSLEDCSKEDKPMYCQALIYNGRTLPADRAPKAWGSNLCEASNGLLLESCGAHLRPSLISELKCEPTSLHNKCPVLVDCPENYQPAICKIELDGDEKQTLQAYGENQCIALTALKQQLCQLELNPDKIEEAKCEEK